MNKISDIFKLHKTQYELDFVNIDIDTDTPLFLDPTFIKNQTGRFALECNNDLDSFSEYLFNLLRSNRIQKARDLFLHLSEPNETCLGLSSDRPQGRSIGPTDTESIFNSLINSGILKIKNADKLEDFRLFVHGISKDKISDMTTKIIWGNLIKYTQEQCHYHNIPLTSNVNSGYWWDRHNKVWMPVYTDMLVVEGKKIVLVPKSIVSFSREYTPQRYIQHFILNFLQDEFLRIDHALVRTKVLKNGEKKRYVSKKDIENHIDFSKEYLVAFTENNPEVFCRFKDKNLPSQPLQNQEIDASLIDIESVCKFLQTELIKIPTGGEYAGKYHRLIKGILELLLYPSLNSPRLEKEIHEGRKRIDIVFSNCAEKGFFSRLHKSHNIPAINVMVECKNYSSDITNPELDQLSGRFSPNRGRVGLILFRNIEKMDKLLNRCQDTWKDDRGLIIPISDIDILNMLEKYPEKGIEVVESLLQGKFQIITVS